MRSHPPTLITLAKRTLREECGVTRETHVLVAVSGGPDSIALLHVCCILRAKGAVGRVTAHGVDHGLRAEAAAELALGAKLASSFGVAFGVTRVDVPQGGNLQARARAARYEALEAARTRAGADVIATGHHRDDRAETVLIRLLRGAPSAGLAVLPPREGARIRPLIRASRDDVRAHVARHELAFAEDPSNHAPRFLRTRVRSELLPLLTSMSPRIVDHLVELADELARAARRDEARVPPALDPRVQSRRALAELGRLAAAPQEHRLARVSLKGGVVLSPAGAQALRDTRREASSQDSPPELAGSHGSQGSQGPRDRPGSPVTRAAKASQKNDEGS